ncbi:hypothetical protein PNIG_a1557 [Pseudoalteromonas nigrifaciens]|uniref:DUF4156 domain-containing protein n=2 Tax=Pseudoalteromonas nigrifaciens TaxID=28109 RepID=A0AAC9XXG1_9GAMM|nr:DUF4156 domain-containing protein [Pseudoalteromonas nigrifaciens]ASM53704.1 hypothetical protein PNIG_a1557 [Pseudoalteromonas nigrifaciens]GEN40697.1 hypothetical protein PNI02_01630 [Pseudoalteromonas nigrifaciens]SUC52453.1 Uncharacterised protein [Pseudoalteromonas nigrifaciens]
MKIHIVFISLLLTSCVTIPELKSEANNVKVVSTDRAVISCQSLGLVYGYSDNGFEGYAGAAGISQRHSVYDAQNKAYDLGADTILIINTNPRIGGTDTAAEAFKCNF